MCLQNADAPTGLAFTRLSFCAVYLAVSVDGSSSSLDCELSEQDCIVLIFISSLIPGIVFGTWKVLNKCLLAGCPASGTMRHLTGWQYYLFIREHRIKADPRIRSVFFSMLCLPYAMQLRLGEMTKGNQEDTEGAVGGPL